MTTTRENLGLGSWTKGNNQQRLAVAQQQLLEIEAQIIHALGLARSSLTATQHENRELLRNHANGMRIYTEREFAGLLKVSVSTIARLRKAGKIDHLLVGNQIRYSTTHFSKVDETFSTAGRAHRLAALTPARRSRKRRATPTKLTPLKS